MAGAGLSCTGGLAKQRLMKSQAGRNVVLGEGMQVARGMALSCAIGACTAWRTGRQLLNDPCPSSAVARPNMEARHLQGQMAEPGLWLRRLI